MAEENLDTDTAIKILSSLVDQHEEELKQDYSESFDTLLVKYVERLVEEGESQ